jgi:polyhydroxyalkanoate synthesis regulator phasin
MDSLLTILGIIISVLVVFIGWVASNVVQMKVTVGKTEAKIDNLLNAHSEHKADAVRMREEIHELNNRVSRLEANR